MTERLQKLLAAAGHGSRRGIEEWIRAGRVTVNGKIAALGDRASAADTVTLDGKPLSLQGARQHQVLMYHKPVGEVTTRNDPEGRPTVFDRLPSPRAGRWIVVGRLDTNTTGLLLFTTDGELAHRLMHPSAGIEREYLVRVHGLPDESVLARLRAGVVLDGEPARFLRIERGGQSESHSWFRVVLAEGRNREVRRLWEAVGFEVSRLSRLRFGDLRLPEGLRPGRWQMLDDKAVQELG
jgi:23S rRNA pseudouridine2605 synthase